MDKGIVNGFHYFEDKANAYKRVCEKINDMQEKGVVTFREIAHLKKKYILLYKEYKARKERFYWILTESGITVKGNDRMSDYAMEVYETEERKVLSII